MNRNILIRFTLVVTIIIAIAGIILGITFYRSNSNNSSKKKLETFNLTLQDMYCNIKDSKRIVKVKITIVILFYDNVILN
ncbi:MAG: hypothetical protein GX320_07730 [Tissierellia bacterium]|nr:hypothetical protein [Tissierellia bacterium]